MKMLYSNQKSISYWVYNAYKWQICDANENISNYKQQSYGIDAIVIDSIVGK